MKKVFSIFMVFGIMVPSFSMSVVSCNSPIKTKQYILTKEDKQNIANWNAVDIDNFSESYFNDFITSFYNSYYSDAFIIIDTLFPTNKDGTYGYIGREVVLTGVGKTRLLNFLQISFSDSLFVETRYAKERFQKEASTNFYYKKDLMLLDRIKVLITLFSKASQLDFEHDLIAQWLKIFD